MYASESGVLSEQMIDERVADALRAHEKKVTWQEEQEGSGDPAAAGTRGHFRSAKDLSSFTPPNGATGAAS